MTDKKDALTRSWTENAGSWIRAVREGSIASRKAGTDAAILDAVAARKPNRFLDAGCGEGFHVRRVRERTGCKGVGIDAVPELIAAARAADPDGVYEELSYGDLVANPNALPGPFDVIAFNYALFDEELVPLLSAARQRLARNGAVIIQTLHPDTIGGGDGWRTEDFAAFDGEEWAPMPWFFRTLASWKTEIGNAGLTIRECIEPAPDPGGAPLSLLMVCETGA